MAEGRLASATGRRRPPWGLVGALALVWAGESAVSRQELHLAGPVPWDWRITSKEAIRSALSAEVLCLGDSLVKLGVQPLALEKIMGRRAFSLAVSGGQPESSYFILRRALGAGARPKAVVVDFIPHMLVVDRVHATRYLPELLGPREALDLARESRDSGLFASVSLARQLPSFRNRLEVRNSVLFALRGQTFSLAYENTGFFRNWRVNRGGQVFGRGLNPGFRGVDTIPPPPAPTSTWRCERVNAIYLKKFFDLAAARGLRVFWLLPPVAPGLQINCERIGDDARYVALVRWLVDQYPNVTVLDGRHVGQTDAQMVDSVHLNREGALALTEGVAATLGRELAGPADPSRWVPLPKWEAPARPFPLEDLQESKVVLEQRYRGLVR